MCLYDFLGQTSLFTKMTASEIADACKILNCQRREYSTGEYIWRAGDYNEYLAVLFKGEAEIFCEDFWGNKHLLAHILPGQFFGETFALLARPLDINVTTVKKAEVIFFDVQSILCGENGSFILLRNNLLKIFAEKNFYLNRKLQHVTQRSLRYKILSYLSECALAAQSNDFYIPLNRQQLADYLSVDRSALSAELGRLRNEGQLYFYKNHFILLSGQGKDY